MLHVYSYENLMLELRIFKVHRKTTLQQTPSTDTPTSFFFYLVWQSALVQKPLHMQVTFLIYKIKCWFSHRRTTVLLPHRRRSSTRSTATFRLQTVVQFINETPSSFRKRPYRRLNMAVLLTKTSREQCSPE